jgi:HD-like signal output (HDOD) protein/GGDEF domain-containing protein
MQDSTPTIERLVARCGRLYSLPAVAIKVLELTADPTLDTQALKECIENDPALSVRILRVVNSSLFGLSREVCDLQHALTLLGTKPLKLLVLGFSLPSQLFTGIGSAALGYYWRHALTKAVAAREICQTLWQQPGDEAFLAGLLQDLGVLVLIKELGKPYARFLDRLLSQGGELAAMEVQAMGFDHVQLSARLLVEWGLPSVLTEAIGWRHGPAHPPPEKGTGTFCRNGPEGASHKRCLSPFPGPPPRLAEVLRLAEWVARLLADRRTETLGHLLDGAARQGLEPTRLEEIVQRLEEKVQQLADVLSLQLPGGWNYRDLLQQAHQQLADAAAEAVGDLVGPEKGDSPHLCEAPSGPFRQMGTVPFFRPAADGRSLLEEFEELADAAARVAHRQAPAPPREKGDSPHLCEAPSGRAPTEGWSRQMGTVPFFRPAGRSADTDLGLAGALADAATACRQSRCPLSLLLVELDRREEVLSRVGKETVSHLRRLVESACRGLDHPGALCLPHAEAGFALILPDCNRGPAVRLGNQLIDEVRRLAPGHGPDGRSTVSISVGAATVSLPPKNFPARDLLVAAGRCLSGSRASGGSVLKSIEIY